ncbi:MAG: hypothetical protein HFJ35_02940 [Clostridia bacterium]|nr:hypothetical protein [Clostridia bacterium]
MKMSLKDKAKNKAKNKLKKVAFKIIKPFLPFIIIIVGIVFAVCTVADSLFTTEDDMQIAEQLSNENYEEQYAEWLKEKETSPTTITNGIGLIPTRNVYLAYTRLYKYFFSFWYENASNYSVHTNYIVEQM